MRDIEEVLADLAYCEDHIDDQLFGEAKFFIEDLSEANKMKEARLERQKQIIAEQSTKLNDAIRKLESENKVLSERIRALQTELDVNKNPNAVVQVRPNVYGVPDQTAKQDNGKLNPTLVPPELIWAVAEIRKIGTAKYHNDPDNWKKVEKERFRAAAYRHFLRYLQDPQKLDDESCLPNLWHCCCNLAFLCAMEKYDIEGCTW